MKQTKTDRRGFLGKSLGIVGASAMMTAFAERAGAQVPSSGVQPSGRYDNSIIFERKPFTWPGGKSLAIWVSPSVEVLEFESGSSVLAYSTQDYGIRVGLWRIADVLDEAGIKGTAALNSAVCQVYPRAIDEMKKRNWEFMGNGVTTSRTLRKLSLDQERDVIRTVLQTIEQATGKKVRGWVSPNQIETANTPDLLAEAGILYTGDWNNDDQPYRMKVKSGALYSLPYCLQINDADIFTRVGLTGPQYYQSLVDTFDTLNADSQKHPRVMGIPLHPNLTGAPANIKYLRQALQHMKQSANTWFATGAEIVEAYQKTQS